MDDGHDSKELQDIEILNFTKQADEVSSKHQVKMQDNLAYLFSSKDQIKMQDNPAYHTVN